MTKKLEFGMVGAGFAVYKSCGVDDPRYYPNPKKTKQMKRWLEGFNMAFADNELIIEYVPDKKLAKKLMKFDSGNL